MVKEIKIVSVVHEPQADAILGYAKLLRQLVGPKVFLDFLRGEPIEHRCLDYDGSLRVTTYQLSSPAKDVLIEEEKEKTKSSRRN